MIESNPIHMNATNCISDTRNPWPKSELTNSSKVTSNHDCHHCREHEIDHNIDIQCYECEESKDSRIAAGTFLKIEIEKLNSKVESK